MIGKSGRRHCDWCRAFVPKWMPDFTWYRAFGPHQFVNGLWTQVGPDFGWTKPQSLCRNCAESAQAWRACHKGEFAEVEP